MLLGYFEFALLLFLPGLATLLLFNQIRASSIVTILARSYGLSLALNASIVFAGIVLARIPVVYGIIAAVRIRLSDLPPMILIISLVLVLLLSAARFRSQIKALKSVRPGWETSLVFLLGIVSAALILSEFAKYPIFPKSYSVDFIQHVILLRNVALSISNPALGILYYGVHYNLALGLFLVGGDPLVQIQYLMGILAAPASLLFYEACRRIYLSEKLALLGQFLFIATGFLWYVPLYDTGLYPNLFAVILSFAFIVELRNAFDDSSNGRFVTLIILAAGLFLSHYFSAILIVASLLSLALAGVLKVVGWRKVAIPFAILLAPLGFVAVRPDLVESAQQIYAQTGPGGFFSFSTPLADFFSFNPFLRYAVAIVFNYGSVVIIFGLPLAIFYTWTRRKEAWPLVTLLVWVTLMWAFAPGSELAWRFAFEGLGPLLLLTPATFIVAPSFVRWVSGVAPRKERRHRDARNKRYSYGDIIIAIFMLLLVGLGSWTTIMVGDLSSDASSYSAAQSDLYDSMTWFAQHTPSTSALLSVTDWRIAFLNPLTGRSGQLLQLAPGPEALDYAKTKNYGYILVTYLIPAPVPPTLDLTAYYSSFSQNQNLTMVYQNHYDVIYQVK